MNKRKIEAMRVRKEIERESTMWSKRVEFHMPT